MVCLWLGEILLEESEELLCASAGVILREVDGCLHRRGLCGIVCREFGGEVCRCCGSRGRRRCAVCLHDADVRIFHLIYRSDLLLLRSEDERTGGGGLYALSSET